MITFKTIKGKHIITYNGIAREFKTLSEAWQLIFALRQNPQKQANKGEKQNENVVLRSELKKVINEFKEIVKMRTNCPSWIDECAERFIKEIEDGSVIQKTNSK